MPDYFSENLARLMQEAGLNDSRLAYLIGVKRQAVHCWRRGANSPNEANLAALCVTLQCTPKSLLKRPPRAAPRLLTIRAWAKREGIPVSRAKDLFELRLLTGETRTDYTILVPHQLRAPKDSRSLVTMAKVRPRWVPTFHANFPRLMRDRGLSGRAIGEIIGVNSVAVQHWVHRRKYPKRDRLPRIAEALNISVHELAGHV